VLQLPHPPVAHVQFPDQFRDERGSLVQGAGGRLDGGRGPCYFRAPPPPSCSTDNATHSLTKSRSGGGGRPSTCSRAATDPDARPRAVAPGPGVTQLIVRARASAAACGSLHRQPGVPQMLYCSLTLPGAAVPDRAGPA